MEFDNIISLKRISLTYFWWSIAICYWLRLFSFPIFHLGLTKFLTLMQIDEEVLQDVLKKGIEKNHLIESLRNRVQNDVSPLLILIWFSPLVFLLSIWQYVLHLFGQVSHYGLYQATVAYYLLVDSRSPASSGYLGAEFQEVCFSFTSFFLLRLVDFGLPCSYF